MHNFQWNGWADSLLSKFYFFKGAQLQGALAYSTYLTTWHFNYFGSPVAFLVELHEDSVQITVGDFSHASDLALIAFHLIDQCISPTTRDCRSNTNPSELFSLRLNMPSPKVIFVFFYFNNVRLFTDFANATFDICYSLEMLSGSSKLISTQLLRPLRRRVKHLKKACEKSRA